ncbi:MAG TPA: peroxide stress protein YaaA, partial [Lapillicoccus sp.]|nr:peroxide stress protein YaaA [Lapillicoccus sp.]
MLVLLPPSEGKTVPRRGRSLDLSTLSFPGLTTARQAVLRSLVVASKTPDALEVLGVPPTLGDEVA